MIIRQDADWPIKVLRDKPTNVTNEKRIDYCRLLNKGNEAYTFYKENVIPSSVSFWLNAMKMINKGIYISRINQNTKLKVV